MTNTGTALLQIEVVDNLEQYCVVIERSANTTEILRNSVLRTLQGSQEIYLMKNKLSINLAVEKGTLLLNKTGIDTGQVRWRIGRS